MVSHELQKAVDFHGHLCPGLVIGYRAALIGLRELGAARSEDEELVTTVYTDSCAADAVQVLTGCTFGKGNLKLKHFGKHVFIFSRRGKADSLRVALRFGTLEQYTTEALLNAAEDTLFKTGWIKYELPSEARVYSSVQCALCGEGVMETKIRVRQGMFICSECAERESYQCLIA